MNADTVKAIISSRLHVMDNYARKVIKPVHASEMRLLASEHGQNLKRAARDLLKVDERLDEASRLRIASALSSSEVLQTVYEFQHRLQAIWQAAGASQEMLLQALQDWCRQAEQTGIQCLQEFAMRLRGYELKPFNG